MIQTITGQLIEEITFASLSERVKREVASSRKRLERCITCGVAFQEATVELMERIKDELSRELSQEIVLRAFLPGDPSDCDPLFQLERASLYPRWFLILERVVLCLIADLSGCRFRVLCLDKNSLFPRLEEVRVHDAPLEGETVGAWVRRLVNEIENALLDHPLLVLGSIK